MRELRFAIIVFLLGNYCVEVSPKRISSYAGPYRIIFLKVRNVSDEYKSQGLIWINLHGTQVRGKQLQHVWGFFQFAVTVTDALNFEVNLAARQNNRWRRNAISIKFDRGCTSLVTHAESMLRFGFGPDHDLTCPIKPLYLREIKNQTVDLKFPHFPVMPYGRYLVDFRIFQGGKTLGGAEIEADFIPRL